jgi:ankyrin repeat protein
MQYRPLVASSQRRMVDAGRLLESRQPTGVSMEDDWYTREQLHFAAIDGNLSRAQELIASGYNVNAFDDGLRYTPLHYAAKGEFLALARYLISVGADVNARDEARIGETPLGAASYACSYEMAKLLVDAGADPSIPGWMGLTAVHRAKDRKDDEGQQVFDLLIKTARNRPRRKKTSD